MPTAHQRTLLQRHLGPALGLHTPPQQAPWLEAFTWQALPAGQTLMNEGDPAGAMYLVLSGRLRAWRRNEAGALQRVREVGRGEVVGEIGLYTQVPRSATLTAVRDTLLARLDEPAFQALLQQQPQAGVALTRQLIHRLQTQHRPPPPAPPVTVALLPITAGVDAPALAARLAQALAQATPSVRLKVIDASVVQQVLGAQAFDDGDALQALLDRWEAEHDHLLLVADAGPSPWSRRCRTQADEVLLLADADAPPVLHAHEATRPEAPAIPHGLDDVLLLLHPAQRRCPQGTAAWLARRPVGAHLHIRPELARDWARLARMLSRTARGLVLAGGGARGLAHLGVMQGLEERGLMPDAVGGTSIGAVMAALAAADQPVPTLVDVARQAFRGNPTGDVNWLPLLSLLKGERMRRAMAGALNRLFGAEPQIEDLWLPYFCLASNYSRASEQVLRQGPLSAALQASTAIPGALPPVVWQGDLLCDGGSFNNFPVDVMRAQHGVGWVMGVDLSPPLKPPLELQATPGPWALLRDRLRPRARRRYPLPTLTNYLLNVTVLYGQSRRDAARALTDLYFHPALARVGMLQWSRFDDIVAQGAAHAREVLASAPLAEPTAKHA